MRTLNIQSFGALLRALAPVAEMAAQSALVDHARDIQEDARRRIGTYQGATGPFAAWQELADATKEERIELGYTANDPLLRTGELRAAITLEYRKNEAVVGVPDMQVGAGTKADPVRNIGDIAVDQEFGTSRGIPPRPFLGPAAFMHAHAMANGIAHALADAVGGKPYKKWTGGGNLSDIPF